MVGQCSSTEIKESCPFNLNVSQTTATVQPILSILLTTNFAAASRQAFHTALDLCRIFAARLILLHVFEYADSVTSPEGQLLVELPTLLSEAKSRLRALRGEAMQAGIPCDWSVQGGEASETIECFIRTREIDLVVMGTSALRGFERLVFGSTAETVMRKAPVPVLIVGPRADAKAISARERPVVFATDFHLSTVGAIGLAAAVSRATASPLHCVHVLPRSVEGAADSDVIPNILTEALQHVAINAGVAIDDPVCATTFGSEVSSAVVNYAKEHHAKLIVLGVRQSSLASSHGPAHIAYRIVTEASCPVLTMAFGSHPESHTAAPAVRAVASIPMIPEGEPCYAG